MRRSSASPAARQSTIATAAIPWLPEPTAAPAPLGGYEEKAAAALAVTHHKTRYPDRGRGSSADRRKTSARRASRTDRGTSPGAARFYATTVRAAAADPVALTCARLGGHARPGIITASTTHQISGCCTLLLREGDLRCQASTVTVPEFGWLPVAWIIVACNAVFTFCSWNRAGSPTIRRFAALRAVTAWPTLLCLLLAPAGGERGAHE